MLAVALGLAPDPNQELTQTRVALAESIALNCMLGNPHRNPRATEERLKATVQRDADLMSAALRRSNGEVFLETGGHAQSWGTLREESDANHMIVPLSYQDDQWGTLELSFRPTGRFAIPVLSQFPWMIFGCFIVCGTLAGSWLYLRRILVHLDPGRAVPGRVRQTLDTLAESLVVVDKGDRIVLANSAFAQSVNADCEALVGQPLSKFPWEVEGDEELPWLATLERGSLQLAKILTLRLGSKKLIFKTNCAPVMSKEGAITGAFVSLNDVTSIEERNARLQEMMKKLENSKDHIQQQNRKLEQLATRDPLTSCLNRRAFRQQLETTLDQAREEDSAISFVMVDIDHFKSVNDNHGHAKGDEVLKTVSGMLRHHAEEIGLVCRYGGEEFTICLPAHSEQEACVIAEQIRVSIESQPIGGLKITASLGVAEMGDLDAMPEESFDTADRALYAAKRTGRNRVMAWSAVPDDMEFSERVGREQEDDTEVRNESKHIPYSAVIVLESALHFRHAPTAEHSRRVAELCVEIAEGIMSEEDRYVLEVAALLHDIGKLGVPDVILHKPGKLSDAEWKVMKTHQRIGLSILGNAFPSPALTEIVTNYKRSFEEMTKSSDCASRISTSARILKISDAFDSLVTDHPYRAGKTIDEAIGELRRWGGKQFDPEIVERLVSVVQSRRELPELDLEGFSREGALSLGLQVEKLACSLDSEDRSSLSSMAASLARTAHQYHLQDIEGLASRLKEQADSEDDWLDVVETTSSLLDVCRIARRAASATMDEAPAAISKRPVS